MGQLSFPVLFVFVTVITFEAVFTIPVSIPANGRTLRSVTLNRHSPQDQNPSTKLLLSQAKRVNNTLKPILAQRENNTGNGDGTTLTGDGSNVTMAGRGVGGDGTAAARGVDGDGTISNDTQVGSRLKQNETDAEPCSLEPPVLCSMDSSRDKERRIAHILQYVWSNLVGNQTRPSTPINNETVRERFTPVNPSTSSFYGGIQSIAASCNIPPAVESEAWSVQNSFNLYFNLTAQYPDIFRSVANSEIFSSEQQQSMESGQSHEYVPNVGTRPLFSPTTVTPKKSVNIVSAKLRLYKTVSAVSPDVSTLLTIEPSEPCNDIEATSDSDEVEPNPFPTRVTISEPSPITDKKIRVSVYWYTQPATKNHYKKKLVDAKMLSLRESSWVEFDIKNAVKSWLNDRRPNYGLVVEVENEDQDALDPSKYFRSAPCVKSSSETEVTNGAVQEQENSDKSGGDMNTSSSSPVIEICSLNVPEASTSYEQTKFFPLSMNINSFNHLRRVAESHAKSSNGSQNPWQTIHLPALSPEIFDSGIERSNETSEPTDVASHRHRHHHGSNSQNGTNNFMRHIQPTAQNRSRVSHPRNLLGEDHPLRTILATVNGNSKELNKRGSSTLTQHLPESLVKGFPLDVMSQMHADESSKVRADYHDSIENDKDVFITKIVITPAQRNDNSLHRLAGTRGLFPFGSLSSIYPTNPTNSDSTER